MRSRFFLFLAPVLLATVWGAAWGCSASGQSNEFEETTKGTSGDPGSGGAGGGSTMSGEGGFINTDGGAEAGFDPDAACAATGKEAQLIPLDILIVQDKSGSMSGQNWDGTTTALKTYANSPDAAGVYIGLVFFPLDNPPDGETCNFEWYKDLDVPIEELPGNAAAFTGAIDSTSPNGGTPMYGALKGGLFVATAHQDANPTHKVIVVLASDGDPNACGGVSGNPANADTIPAIAALAKSALNYNGVRTYAIAINGSNVANLNQIAAAGGTGAALDVTQNINLFLDKMKEIQANALSCDFLIPEAPPDKAFDKDLVAVSYVPSIDPTMTEEIPRADNYQDCGGKAGWYYDNNVKPTKIILCPVSCQKVQADKEARVDVLFGCAPDIN
jgi:hypothetical protein